MSDVLIDARWHSGAGEPLRSLSPSDGSTLAIARAASSAQVSDAVGAAAGAAPAWARVPFPRRGEALRAFAEILRRRRRDLADALVREIGKPRWDADAELDAAAAKVELTIAAAEERLPQRRIEQAGAQAVTRYRPLGVVAVIAPFNLPVHLPGAQIVPALLSGNAVVLKPSPLALLVSKLYAECLLEAFPMPGVVNLVPGGAAVADQLARDPRVRGVMFTGSFAAGRALSRAVADDPSRLLMLEMGGNNPLVIDAVGDPRRAARHAAYSAYVGAGQRCTCARRLILPRGASNDDVLHALLSALARIVVALPDAQPPPLIGPLIHADAARRLLAFHERLLALGGRSLVPPRALGPENLVTPGLIDVTGVEAPDEEVFGPLLQVVRVDDFDAAIDEANRTRFGLSAALFSDDARRWEQFAARVRAGVVNFNRPTVGSAGVQPFGGVGCSGNHRPAGYFAIDACVDPVASLEATSLPDAPLVGLPDA